MPLKRPVQDPGEAHAGAVQAIELEEPGDKELIMGKALCRWLGWNLAG